MSIEIRIGETARNKSRRQMGDARTKKRSKAKKKEEKKGKGDTRKEQEEARSSVANDMNIMHVIRVCTELLRNVENTDCESMIITAAKGHKQPRTL